MSAWYDDIIEAYGEYCLEYNDQQSDNNEANNNGNDGHNTVDNPSNVCKDNEPKGNSYCKNVRRYGGCDDDDNGWYFDKYCPKTCHKCENEENINGNGDNSGGENGNSDNGKDDENKEDSNTDGSESSCKDVASNCKENNARPKDRRTCSGPQKHLYAIYCKKSCGLCGKQKNSLSTTAKKCEDTGDCGWFSKLMHGGCSSNYFQKKCRKLCNIC